MIYFQLNEHFHEFNLLFDKFQTHEKTRSEVREGKRGGREVEMVDDGMFLVV